jgi:hypothetical protein
MVFVLFCLCGVVGLVIALTRARGCRLVVDRRIDLGGPEHFSRDVDQQGGVRRCRALDRASQVLRLRTPRRRLNPGASATRKKQKDYGHIV